MSTERQYTTKDIARFYSKVSTIPTEQGCLEWMAYRNPLGYGGFNVNGKCVAAYRVAWEIVNGPIPAGLVIRHMCHNPQCVNPAHLLIGTQADNIHDMIRSGRFQNAPNTNTPYVRPVMPPKEEQFYAQVSKTPTDTGCLEWLGSLNENGYGSFNFPGKSNLAHRIAWMLVNGPIPDGLHCCHKCDNRKCCNPAHIFLGTPADNIHDMMNKGRRVSYPREGEQNSNARVGAEQVLEIRSDLYIDWTITEIAKHFGIGKSQVSNILRRESWPHLDAAQDAQRESGPPKGEHHPAARITEQDVIAIRSDLYRGWTHRAIGEKFGISREHVRDILNRKRWAHV